MKYVIEYKWDGFSGDVVRTYWNGEKLSYDRRDAIVYKNKYHAYIVHRTQVKHKHWSYGSCRVVPAWKRYVYGNISNNMMINIIFLCVVWFILLLVFFVSKI